MTTGIVEYRPISGFPAYRVGNDGSVWSCLKRRGYGRRVASDEWTRLNPSPNIDGYPVVSLSKDGRGSQHRVQVLVLEAFVGPRPAGMLACHSKGRWDCSLSNLRWDTHLANQQDRLRDGTHNRGARSYNAKLTVAQVAEIRRLYVPHVYGAKRLAKRFGVDPATIQKIISGKSWRGARP